VDGSTDIQDFALLTLPQGLKREVYDEHCMMPTFLMERFGTVELTVVLMPFSVDMAGVAVNAPSAVAAPMPLTPLTATSAARLPAELMEADDPPCRYQGLRLMLDTK